VAADVGLDEEPDKGVTLLIRGQFKNRLKRGVVPALDIGQWQVRPGRLDQPEPRDGIRVSGDIGKGESGAGADAEEVDLLSSDRLEARGESVNLDLPGVLGGELDLTGQASDVVKHRVNAERPPRG
jgi:hypothetical protein